MNRPRDHHREGEALHAKEKVDEVLQQQEAHRPDGEGRSDPDLPDEMDRVCEDIGSVRKKENEHSQKGPPEQGGDPDAASEDDQGDQQGKDGEYQIGPNMKIRSDDGYSLIQGLLNERMSSGRRCDFFNHEQWISSAVP